MSERVVISVKVQDRKLRDLGPIQGAGVGLIAEGDPTSNYVDYATTDSQGLAVFIVGHGVYEINITRKGYRYPIVDFIGTELVKLVIDTRQAAQRFPVFANMTRDE